MPKASKYPLITIFGVIRGALKSLAADDRINNAKRNNRHGVRAVRLSFYCHFEGLSFVGNAVICWYRLNPVQYFVQDIVQDCLATIAALKKMHTFIEKCLLLCYYLHIPLVKNY
jgi:hypothetical protein